MPDGASPDAGPSDGAPTDDGGTPDADQPDLAPRCWGLPHATVTARYRLELVPTTTFAGNGTYVRPVQLIKGHDQDGTFFLLAQQTGQVTEFREGLPPAVVLDIESKLWRGHDEAGLVSIALHPDFPTVPDLFAVFATPGGPSQFLSRVARFSRGEDGTFAVDSERIVLDLPQPHGSHSVNQVEFGPDGYLYISSGDSRNGDPFAHAQNTHTLYGAILRLDVSDQTGGYTTPADNPFSGEDGAPEIYAYGLRNPWRFSFDRATGQLWAGDVGQSTYEEIDKIVMGGNYGWPRFEGHGCYRPPDCDDEGMIPPVFHYPHSEGKSVTGGYVYRGNQMPELVGAYIFSDYVSGTIWALRESEGGVAVENLIDSGFPVVSFFHDDEGELFVLRYARNARGGIYRLLPRPPMGAGPPTLLSQTGCFASVPDHHPAPHLFPYTVNSELWSDGAEKIRYMALPPDTTINVLDDGDFEFPIGTTLVKSFGYDERVHETRLLVNTTEGWSGYTYEWQPDGMDAVLLDNGKNVTLPGGKTWHYPSRSQCLICHNAAANFALGLEVGQLPAHGPGALADWHGRGFLDPRFVTPADVPTAQRRFADPASDAPLGNRARAYLHANCSFCHRPDGRGRGDLDLRFDVPLADAGLCDALPEHGYLYTGDTTLRIVAPERPQDSILWRRMTSLNRFRMPAIGSAVVDTQGTELIFDWIAAPDTCTQAP